VGRLIDAPTLKRLLDVIDAWRGRRILVLGDMVADEHVVGRPLAIAREAPVMVLEHVSRQVLPGGAMNFAANARALGASVAVCGVVGDDESGRTLTVELERRGIATDGVLVEPTRPTTTKTRIWAGGAQQHVPQLMLRLDRGERGTVDDRVSAHLAAYVTRSMGEADALMLSDYENGVIQPRLIAACLEPARRLGKTVTVDSHGDLQRFRGATLFTPNQPEAEATLGRNFGDTSELERGGAELLEKLEAQAVLITRGQEGMSLFQRGEAALHAPVVESAAVDPTGAGDTVAAAFTLAVVAGAALADAVPPAGVAASIVVARVGTAVASHEDMVGALHALAD